MVLRSNEANWTRLFSASKSAAAAHNDTISPDQLKTIKANMLNRLIQIQILLQQSTDADKADGKAKAGLQVSNLLVQAGSQEVFDRQLKSVGMTPDELRAKITEEATATATLTRESRNYRERCRSSTILQ